LTFLQREDRISIIIKLSEVIVVAELALPCLSPRRRGAK
jgi:hypothetical protein